MLAFVGVLFLPVPPLVLGGPLAGLLLLARPASLRERAWLAAGLLLVLLTFATGRGGPAQDVLRAGAALFAGGFVAASAWSRRSALWRGVAASAATVLGLGAWAALAGYRWDRFRSGIENQVRDAVAMLAGGRMPAEQVSALEASVATLARLYPGIAIACALAAGVVAARLAWHLGAGRAAPEPTPLAEFRFNDHLIWGALITAAAALLTPPGAWSDLALNGLVLWAVVYATRGLALAVAFAGRWPVPVRVGLSLSAILLLPYALGASLLAGLADTWLDFRRALSRPGPEGDIQ